MSADILSLAVPTPPPTLSNEESPSQTVEVDMTSKLISTNSPPVNVNSSTRPEDRRMSRFFPFQTDKRTHPNFGQGAISSPPTDLSTDVPLSTIIPGPVWPTESQLKVARCYGIRNDDGTFTRLIRVDEIGQIDHSTLQLRCGPQNMIVLPALSLPCTGEERMIPASIISSLPPNRATRVSNTHPPHQDMTQIKIDTIISRAVPGQPSSSPRRPKVYCDKWIHEGVCAFTQQGCKYRHEMPHDKATQVSLGLNHGYPLWYKNDRRLQFAETPAQPAVPAWRMRNEASSNYQTMSVPFHAAITERDQTPRAFTAPNYGPIAPPSTARGALKASNSFGPLADEEKGEKNDTVIYLGRHTGRYD